MALDRLKLLSTTAHGHPTRPYRPRQPNSAAGEELQRALDRKGIIDTIDRQHERDLRANNVGNQE